MRKRKSGKNQLRPGHYNEAIQQAVNQVVLEMVKINACKPTSDAGV